MKDATAMTQAERTRKHREKRKEDGWVLVQIYLEPRSNAILEATKDRYNMTTAQAVNHLIHEAV